MADDDGSWIERRRPRRTIGPQHSVFSTIGGESSVLLNQWVVPELVRRFARDVFDRRVAAASAEEIVNLYLSNRAAFEGIMQQALVLVFAADEFQETVESTDWMSDMFDKNPAIAILQRYYGGAAKVKSLERYGRKLGARLFEVRYCVPASRVIRMSRADITMLKQEDMQWLASVKERVRADRVQDLQLPGMTAGAVKTGQLAGLDWSSASGPYVAPPAAAPQ